MRTSEQIAAMLAGYEVSHFFFVPVILPETLKQMPAHGITPVMTHGEKAAAYMADGYARVTRKVGVCGAQAIGSTNLAAGLRDAYMARVPLIAMSGAPDDQAVYRNLYQDVDDQAAFGPVTKWNARVPGPARFPDLLRQAFRAASGGVSRPVHLALAGRTGNPGDFAAEGDGRAEPRYAVAPADRPLADPAQVASAIAALGRARRPVLLAGGGVARSGAEQELREFAEAASLPVLLTLNGISSLGYGHPLYGGVIGEYGADGANRILLEADAIVVAGSSLGSMTTRSWSLVPREATLIQIDLDGEETGRNYRCAVPLIGDVRAVLRQLTEAGPPATPAGWLDRVTGLRGRWRDEVAASESSDAVPMRPERLFMLASTELADDGILVGDTGHVGAWTARHVRLRPGQQMIRAAGSLGWGLPAAIGAKCARPEREVVCVTGDAGFYYHLAELETARRYGVNVIVVINNNLSMNQEARYWQEGSADQERYWRFCDVDFAGAARSFGCHGTRVDDPRDLASALDKARGAGLPAVIDARTDASVAAPASFGPAL